MNKRLLIGNFNRQGDSKSADSTNRSLFNVIKKNTNALLLKDFQGHSKTNESSDVLRSLINSGKGSLNPLSRLLYNNDKSDLLKSFITNFNEKFETEEILGFISQQNSSILSENVEYFNQTLTTDIHIFKSESARFSQSVIVLKGSIDGRNYEFLLSKKKIKWFLRCCQVTEEQFKESEVSESSDSILTNFKCTLFHSYGLSQKLISLLNSKDTDSFESENLSLVLFDPMFLCNNIVIANAFMVIY